MYVDYVDQLPQNLEAEESVLGAILFDSFAIEQIKDTLVPEDFLIKAHQIIFDAALQLHKRRKKTDLVTVATWLSDRDQLDLIGGQGKLAHLIDSTISAHNIDLHAQLVRTKAIQRQLMHLGHDIATQAARPLEKPADVLTAAKHQLKALESAWRLSKGDRQDEIDFHLLDQELEEIESIEDPAKRRWLKLKLRKRWGIRSGRELDELHATWLMGKKTLSLKNPREFFKDHSKNIKFYLESFIPEKSLILLHSQGGVGKTRLIMSMIRALIAGEPWGDYRVDAPRRVLLIQSDQGSAITAKLLDVQGFLSLPDHLLCNLAIPEQHWSIDDFGALKKAIAAHKPDIIVIDSLTSVNANSIVSENDVEYARPLIRLRKFAEEFDCTFLIIHHSNQQGGSRGTSAIRNTVDEVWRLEKDTKDPEGLRNLFTIEKTRSRAPASYRLQYDDEAATWTITDKMQGEHPEMKSTWKSQIIAFLKKNEGTGVTRNQITEALQMNAHTCRRELSSLLGESLINTCRGLSRSVLYYWGDIYPENSLEESDQHLDQVDQDVDRIPNPDTESDSSEKNFKDQKDRPISNSVSDQNLKTDDLFDQLDQTPPKPLPSEDSFKDRDSDRGDLSDRVCDQKFAEGDRLVCTTGKYKDLTVIGPKPDSLFLLLKAEGQDDPLEFTEQELQNYGYQKQAEPRPDTPPFPRVGDRICRPPDRRLNRLVVANVTEVLPTGCHTDEKYHVSHHCWNKGEWKPAPMPPSMPCAGAKIYAEVNGDWKPITVRNVSKYSFTGVDRDSNYYKKLKNWRWPDAKKSGN
ncbi:DnaB-like helicase N-terminal domain-containing protein [Oscillatoria laete-virens NRMC-F 0139]|nr:DnaB-like helicase N-terminal domain-containing protein [Oscillatoria laete-virens]MDL5053752.1 DnaB-like helicase N-terminal domain-containing protein [Oscillatoria laete-virens NRMC-F 0139]